MTRRIEDLHQRIDELTNLEQGWYDPVQGDGETITPAAIAEAKRLVEEEYLAHFAGNRVGIFPILDGGLQFEWEVGNLAMTIEILPDGSSEWDELDLTPYRMVDRLLGTPQEDLPDE